MSTSHATDYRQASGLRDYESIVREAELNGPGLFAVKDGDPERKFITNVRRLAGNARTPGSRVIAFATWALFALGAGLLYVSFSAQFAYVFGIKHESAPAVIEALSPDVAMVILSALGIGLALAGKASKAERFLIVSFAALAAGMNYAAADSHDWRSVVAYMAPPIVLAIITDRVISVIRRHVLPEDHESAWKPLGTVIIVAAKALVILLAYLLRIVFAPRETVKGLRRMLLDATPVPGMIVAEVVEQGTPCGLPTDSGPCAETWPCSAVHSVITDDGTVAIEPPGEADRRVTAWATKKQHFLSLYRGHPAYGDSTKAAAAAAELAPLAGLQAGTGRTYVIEELRRLDDIHAASLNGSKQS